MVTGTYKTGDLVRHLWNSRSLGVVLASKTEFDRTRKSSVTIYQVHWSADPGRVPMTGEGGWHVDWHIVDIDTWGVDELVTEEKF